MAWLGRVGFAKDLTMAGDGQGESNFEYLQQQLASAMSSGAVALTKLWS